MERFTNKDIFIIPSMLPKDLSSIPVNTCNPNTPSPSDATSLFGLQSLLFTIKVITGFIATHTYPAFQVADDKTIYKYGIDGEFLEAEYKLPQKNAYKYADWNTDLYRQAGVTTTPRTISDETTGSIHTLSLHGSTFFAKPAPFYPEINYGEPAKIPNFPGYLFPWFPALHEPSSHTILNIMRTYFFRLIQKENKSTWSAYNQGVQRWYKTDLGKSITHILFCIQIAIESQARLYLIVVKGEYMGSVILGHKFNIMINGILVPPMENTQLLEHASALDKHSSALEKLLIKVRTWKLIALGSSRYIAREQFKTCRQVYTEISLRDKPSDENEKQEVLALLQDLTFLETYYPVNAEHLKRVVSSLSSSEEPDITAPMYLEPIDFLKELSPVYTTLSVFGPIAPSFFDANGPAYKIPLPGADDPLSKVDDQTKKQPLDSLLISLKKLSIAVQDMEVVIRKREVRMNLKERAAGYRTIRFPGKARDEIWEQLKLLPWVERSGEKRKERDEGNSMDIESAPKRSKFEGFSLDNDF
jgi:hypothetical protein